MNGNRLYFGRLLMILFLGIFILSGISGCDDDELDLSNEWQAEYTILADRGWQDTIKVTGSAMTYFREVDVIIKGSWSATDDGTQYDAEGEANSRANSEFICPGKPKFSLIGQMDNGECFHISDGHHFQGLTGSSVLQLSMNDREFENNSGALNVIFYVKDVHYDN